MSVSSRLLHSVIDELGIDPLRDTAFEAIQQIRNFTHYTITETEQFNLPLISHRVYGESEFWWVIQIYSKVADPFTLVKGTVLRIPLYSEVVTILTESLQQKTKIKIVEI